MVNPAITASLLAAANKEEIQEKIEARLKKANATSRASAIALELKDKERKLLDQALAAGTVQRTDDGRLYLNELAIANRNEGQGFTALLILLIIASVIASVAVLASRAGS
ncbi:MAG TPA: hypothetical protein VNJ05_10915 [Sphingomicrobium sp.]|nr:hypothetical protein [Sphingomicrobium sp.]